MDDSAPFEQGGGICGPTGAIQHYNLKVTKDGSVMMFVGRDGEPVTKPMYVSDFLRHLDIHYDIPMPEGGWREVESFDQAEVEKLRPIAETLAMLSGNAFFGNTYPDREGKDRQWYEMYLPQAHALYEANGGDAGWAGESSFAK
jgi:hypothetical protein